MADDGVPTLIDVLAARRRIRPYLAPTPLHTYPALDALLGASVWVKHENHQPVRAFKVRGAVNLLAQLSAQERSAGVIAASTGNHGLSVAYAGQLFEVPTTICVPQGANPAKVAGIRSLGAQVVEHGADFDAAREHCEQLAASRGYRYVHSGNEPAFIAGVGTAALEILQQRPEVEVIVVPVGGGSGAAGACVVASAVNPSVQVVGVQSAAAPAAYRSWRARQLLADEMGTFAEGLATRVAFELPQRILWRHLGEFLLVEDAEIRHAMRVLIETTSNLVEAAGAAALAAALRLREQLAGRTVALIASGGNVTPAQLLDVLERTG